MGSYEMSEMPPYQTDPNLVGRPAERRFAVNAVKGDAKEVLHGLAGCPNNCNYNGGYVTHAAVFPPQTDRRNPPRRTTKKRLADSHEIAPAI